MPSLGFGLYTLIVRVISTALNTLRLPESFLRTGSSEADNVAAAINFI